MTIERSSRSRFRLLVAADVTSQVGSQVSVVALPLVALLALRASAFEVGLLVALSRIAVVVFSLPIGAWIDRHRKRPVMVAADLARAVLLLSIPVAAMMQLLTLSHLYVVAVLTGVATVLFDVAHQSYVPLILPRDRLMAGNAVLATIRSTSEMAGPPLGGLLVRVLTAPVAIVADTLSFLVSALVILRIAKAEPAVHNAFRYQRISRQIRDGLVYVFAEQGLRAIMLTVAIGNLAFGAWAAIQPVFLIRDLAVDSATYGILLGVAAIGGIAGSAASGRIAAALGGARYFWVAALAAGLAFCLIPWTGPGPGLAFFVAGAFGFTFALAGAGVAAVTYRQAVCSPELLGRATATMRLFMWGGAPIGGLAGGAGAQLLGTRPALWICACILLVAPVPTLLSPLRSAREFPTTQASPTAPHRKA